MFFRKSFAERYGEDSWALITGANGGIGREFCRQLASKGFNIVAVARNERNAHDVASEIEAEFPGIRVKTIACDMSTSDRDDFGDDIVAGVAELDVSIVINNAGVDSFDHFLNIDPKEMVRLVTVNVMAPMLLTRKLMPKLAERKSGAVINVSSGACVVPTAYYATYAATKSFVDVFTRSIADEFPHLDIMSLKPFDVSTRMIYHRPVDLMTITAAECVSGALKDLGRTDSSYGPLKHKIQGKLYELVPRCMYRFFYMRFVSKQFFEERRIGEEAAKKIA